MNARIMQGTQPLLYIHEDVADSVQWRIAGDTLFLRGINTKNSTNIAVDIILPQVSSISATITTVEIEQINGDSLSFCGKDHSTAAFSKTALGQLALYLNGTSASLNGKSTAVKTLIVRNGYESELKCLDLLPEVFQLPVESTFTLVASGKALGMVK